MAAYDGNQTSIHNLRFPGQYYDEETNLHYNMFRYYEPSLGRFITSDPIGLRGGVNTYGYVGQNPISNIDPLGLFKWTGTIKFRSLTYYLGVATITAELRSECVDGESWEIVVTGEAVSGDYGFPAAEINANVVFDDFKFSGLTPDVFNGTWDALSIGPTAGIVGGPFTIGLGDAQSTDIQTQGMSGDISAISYSYGRSRVESRKQTNCMCQ